MERLSSSSPQCHLQMYTEYSKLSYRIYAMLCTFLQHAYLKISTRAYLSLVANGEDQWVGVWPSGHFSHFGFRHLRDDHLQPTVFLPAEDDPWKRVFLQVTIRFSYLTMTKSSCGSCMILAACTMQIVGATCTVYWTVKEPIEHINLYLKVQLSLFLPFFQGGF